MRRIVLLLCAWSITFGAYAQRVYVLELADKGPAHYAPSPGYLSPAAWQRRSHSCIPVSRADWPVYVPYLQQLAQSGLQIHGYSRWFNLVWGSVAPGTEDALKALPFVMHWMPLSAPVSQGTAHVSACVGPQWGMGQMATEHTKTGLDSLHCRGHQGQGIEIGVFDSGFRDVRTLAAFDSLWAQGRVRTWYDFVDRDSLLFAEDLHGTGVLSRIAALVPGTYVGAAPQARVALARTETVASESTAEMLNWLQAAEWADSLGLHIISSSLNYNTFDNPAHNLTVSDLNGYTALITRAADMAAGRGMLVVNSAGNEGSNSQWQGRITSPCDGDSVLCVGSVSRTGWTVAATSGRGPTADGRIKPDVMAAGQSVPVYLSATVSTSSGTSFAAPYVAGSAACLWQAHPEADAWQIRGALVRTADRSALPDNNYGYGLIQLLKADSLLTQHLDELPSARPLPASALAFRLVPNPARGRFRIELNVPVLAVELRDLQGRSLPINYQAGLTSASIRCEEVPSGMYMVVVYTALGVHTARMLLLP
ncbi:MAG: S8 family peptidase [Bacteroidetes bacterium]|nr:S8 family peptidase [Bacteroidota bacterium]